MTVFIVLAAFWLALALAITGLLLAARHSRLVYGLLFGAKPTADLHQFVAGHPQSDNEQDSRLVA